jgi:hypothetical protein
MYFINLANCNFEKTSYEEFEDTKGVIRICISKKNRQPNGQKKKEKRTNNDLQNIHKFV